MVNKHKSNLAGNSRAKTFDPNDSARVTIKQTNLVKTQKMNIKGKGKAKTFDPNDQAKNTIRQTTLLNNYKSCQF